MEVLKSSINCCDVFDKIRHNFQWFSFKESNGKKVYCMPCIKGTQYRVNNCPSCGKEIRDIQLRSDINE